MGNQLGLVDARGESWKKMKKLTTPAFSLNRLKKSLPVYNSCCKEMIAFLQTQSELNVDVDCMDMIKRCAINTLARVGYGIDINTYVDKENELKKNADNLLDILRFIGVMFLPKVMTLFRIPLFPPKPCKFIEGVVDNTLKSRANENSDRKDILDNLIQTHKNHPDDMTKEVMVKTALQFYADGYTTTAESIVAALYFVVVNPNVEEKLREEIDRVLDNKDDPDGNLTEDDINELNYLDMVFKESMRIAAFAITPRLCTKSWKIPGTDFVIEKGTKVFIPISSLQHDPDYWENPDEFIPERFSEENKGNIRSGTYFPFGQGPRMCLGNNYARFEAKVVLIHILRNFTFVGQDKLPQTFKYDANSFLAPEEGLRLKFEKRDI